MDSSILAAPKSLGSIRRLFKSSALNQAGWVTGIFMFMQLLRLGANVILTHLLSPAIFGIMGLVNSLHTGVELLTDVGIGQNIVVNPRGNEPAFFNTAWTVQIVRGIGLTFIATLAAWPVSLVYKQDGLLPILLACSMIFLLNGFTAPTRFLIQRRQEGLKLSLLDTAMQAIGLSVTIGFAVIMPSVWGMTWALLVSSAFNVTLGYFFMDVRLLKLRIDREHLASMLKFGKWIFISTLTYFVASNFDRLYLPAHIPLALFGVYGIARSMSDLATQLMQRLGGVVIFPAVARVGEALHARTSQIVKLRTMGLALISVGMGVGCAIGDVFVQNVYDPRYAAAAVILPIMLVGAWFSVQATISDAVILGLSKSSHAAFANLAKMIWIVALIPAVFTFGDLFLVFIALALSDIPRYVVLLVAQHQRGLHFGLHDIGLFVIMVATMFLVRLAMVSIGLIDGLVTSAQWHQIHILLATI